MLIAFSGLAGCGKTTAAKHLVDSRGWVRVRFANPMKQMIKVLIEPAGETDRWLDGDYKEKVHPLLGCTPRHALQTLGTEWGRNCIGDDLWVRLTIATIIRLMDQGNSVVVDDVRFENEVRAIDQLNGQVIRLDRPGLIGGNHESERGCSFHRILPNHGTCDDLKALINDLIV